MICQVAAAMGAHASDGGAIIIPRPVRLRPLSTRVNGRLLRAGRLRRAILAGEDRPRLRWRRRHHLVRVGLLATGPQPHERNHDLLKVLLADAFHLGRVRKMKKT